MGNATKLDPESKRILNDLVTEGDELIAVHKDEFLPGLPLPTDVFVKLPSDKFILIAKKGTKSSLGELHVSQSNSIAVFYVRKIEYYSAVAQNLKIAGILVKKPEISVDRRTGFLTTAAKSVHRELEVLGVSPICLDHAMETVNSIVNLINSREEYFQLIRSLNDVDDKLMKSAMGASALSVLIAREMGWTVPGNIEKLALCAFLRDVGLKEMPKELLDKSRYEMNSEEIAIWETHSYRGAQILLSLPEMPAEVVAVALEHHENAIGQGYPRRLRDPKMNPFAKIVALSDLFVDLTLVLSERGKKMSVDSAVHHIEYGLGSPFNKACMVALKRALNIKDDFSNSSTTDDSAAVDTTEASTRKFS